MIHGVINVYKEKGFTSHDVVAKLRGIIGQRKIGHTGTLDPDATGVLPVCLGKATKLCDFLTEKRKTYETVLLLGRVTDTQDVSGTIIKENSTQDITESQVKTCIKGFVGEQEQIPPMYSALKMNGKKLYELARAGIEVERKARTVTLYEIRVKEINLPRITMEVTCSKGTYIRTLCHDIGEKLTCGGCMESLVRTRVERFSIEESKTLSQIEEIVKTGNIKNFSTSIDQMFEQYTGITMNEIGIKLAYNGNEFYRKHIHQQNNNFLEAELLRVYDENQGFIGIYQYEKGTEKFRIKKMFLEAEDKL